MGTIKQFTLRFDTGTPAGKEMMEYLKTRSEQLGVSQNTFLLRLLQKDMEWGNASEASDVFIEKIVAGVEGYLSKMIAAIPVTDMESAGSYSVDRKEAEVEREDKLSDDAMDFLSCF